MNKMKLVEAWKLKIEHIVLASPKTLTPLQKCERISKAIDTMFDEIIKEYKNELVQTNAMLESIEELLDGKEAPDFMLSFSVVRKVDDLIKHNEENAYYAGLTG